VLRWRPADGDHVLVLGAGPLGMGLVMGMRALDVKARLTALVWTAQQGETMRRLGADDFIRVNGRDNQAKRYAAVAERVGGRVFPSKFGHQALVGGFDAVYDCIGTGQTLTDAMKYARPRGTVVEVGTSQISLVDTCPLWFSELNLLGANGRAFEHYEGRRLHTYELVFELLGKGRLNLEGLLTHRFRVDQYKEAFATLADRGRSGAIKVAFEPGSSA
jgi:threonine dehydrogenase-like Zn-dependent dehydrogenase